LNTYATEIRKPTKTKPKKKKKRNTKDPKKKNQKKKKNLPQNSGTKETIEKIGG